MNVTKCYAVWYTGDGLHRVLNAAKQEATITDIYNLLGNGTVTGKQMAERLLDKIHMKLSEEIRSKWDKPISNEKLENALYLDAIQDGLPDIKKKIPIELKCG